MIVVHYLENSRAHRVLWMLEELDLRYEVVRYARDPDTLLAPPALRAVHPLGKSPVLVDNGHVLAESGAIIDYLVERYDLAHRFSPKQGTDDALRYRYFMHYAEGSLMPPLVMSLVFSKVAKAPMPFFARPIARAIAGKALSTYIGPQIRLQLDFLDAELTQRPWFAGDEFSAADVQMSYPIEAAATRVSGAPRLHLQSYIERIAARPAYQQARAAGGGNAPLA